LLYETLPLKRQSVFPSLKARHVLCWCCRLRSPDFLLAAVAMPCGNLNDRRNTLSFCHFQRAQTITRPAMEQIVASSRQMPGRDPVKILFFRAVVIWPIKKCDEAHRMPAQRMDQ